MAIVAIFVESPAARSRAHWPQIVRRAAREAAGALDRLLPPRRFDEAAELPPEWFKYPPI